MGVVPVRPQARDAAAKALIDYDRGDPPAWGWEQADEEERDQYREHVDLVIQAFLAAELIDDDYDLRRAVAAEKRVQELQREADDHRRGAAYLEGMIEKAEVERDALRNALDELMGALVIYRDRQAQPSSASVNDGWEQVIAAYAVARKRVCRGGAEWRLSPTR